jgi:thioredoxin-like negative regulator of GroEL
MRATGPPPLRPPRLATQESRNRVMSTASATNIATVTGVSFGANVLQADGPVAVEFMSYGCGYCQALEPVLQSVAGRLLPREQVFRVNIARERDLGDDYQIAATPTIVMFLNGAEIGRVEGPDATESTLMAELTQPFAGFS